MKPDAIILDLVRHGEVATPGLLCAPSDEALSARGWSQLAKLEQGPQWDLVVSSPSRRCCEFAEELASSRDIPLLLNEGFREIDLGEWTGRTTESIWATEREQLQQLWTNPEAFVAPRGEAMADFIGRVERSASELFANQPGKRVLLLIHAGVIRAILARILGIPAQNVQKFAVAHGKINRLCIYPDGEISLLRWGCSPAELADN